MNELLTSEIEVASIAISGAGWIPFYLIVVGLTGFRYVFSTYAWHIWREALSTDKTQRDTCNLVLFYQLIMTILKILVIVFIASSNLIVLSAVLIGDLLGGWYAAERTPRDHVHVLKNLVDELHDPNISDSELLNDLKELLIKKKEANLQEQVDQGSTLKFM